MPVGNGTVTAASSACKSVLTSIFVGQEIVGCSVSTVENVIELVASQP